MPTVADYLHGISVNEVDDGVPVIGALSPSTIGIVGVAAAADPELFPLNTPALISAPSSAVGLGETGELDTLQSAIADIYDQGATPPIVVVRVEGVDRAAQATMAAGTALTQTGGVFELLRAAVTLGKTPRILLAPDLGFDTAVTDSLRLVAKANSGIFYVDPDDSVTTTVAQATAFADALAAERGQVTWPHVKDPDGIRPLSPLAAGVRALVDAQPGWWKSASNNSIRGIKAMNIPLAFSLGQQDEIDDLNEKGVTTAVAIQGSYRLWGSESASFAVPNRRSPFLVVRRVIDNIGLSLQRGLLWAVDQGITLNIGNVLVDASNAYLRQMRDLGAIIKGESWIDKQLVTEVKNGKLYLDVRFTPTVPLRHLEIRLRVSDDGYEEIFG